MSETEWLQVRLGNVADITMGQAPPGDTVSDDGGGLPFLQGNAEFGSVYPVARLTCTRPAKRCREDDILISVRAPVGELNLADQPYAIGRGLASIRFRAMDPRYGAYALQHGVRQLHRVAQGTTFEAVGRHELADIVLGAPNDRNEQRRIADILDALDHRIKETRFIIGKLKLALDGAMDTFMRNGLGRMRRARLGDFINLQRGFDITAAVQHDGTVPVVSSSGVTGYHDKAMVKGPGVVIGRKGKLGSAYYIDCDFWPHDTSLWVTDFKGSSPKFTSYFLRWLRLERFDAATSVPTLNRNSVHPLPVAVPDPADQGPIVAEIESWEDRIRLEQTTLAKLQSLMRGIADDLLTGRVRVADGGLDRVEAG
jgi:type I restriction enzyme S subunit